MIPDTPNDMTLGEEIANALTHGFGAVLSAVGMVVLLAVALRHGDLWEIVSCSIYGGSLVLLYLCSTLHHALVHPGAKRLFLVLDHAAIFLLIAGTYTPFTILGLRESWGWMLFGLVWCLALFGIVFKCLHVERYRALTTALYVGLGWLALFAGIPLVRALPWDGLLWVAAGGCAYMVGILFFASRRRYAHSVWHLFVVLGSVCHYWAVYRFVLLRSA